MTRRSQRTTITEVAQRAGVSPATVSRVMNGNFVGDPAVADRVSTAAADLFYSPNHMARSLALGRTRAIAFVVPDLANPAFQTILSSLSKTAARDGYRVLVADSAESPTDEPDLAGEIRSRCDAIVLCAPRMSERQLAAVAGSLRPLVLINRSGAALGVPSLSIDYQDGARRLAEHLHTLGHRHLVFLEGPAHSVSNAHRRQGLMEFGASRPEVKVDLVPGGVSSEDGLAAVDSVLASGATAALAYNDLVAIGLIHGLRERGVGVPSQLSVTGCDDIPFARYLSPGLTTASVPHDELGAQAWHRMHALLRGDPAGGAETFATALAVRGSTGPLLN